MKTKPAVLVLVIVTLFQGTSIGQTGGGSAGTAVLSVASGLATKSGTANPLAGRSLLLLKESFGGFLRRKGMFQGPPGSTVKASPLAVWAYACRTGSPACKQALYEAQSIIAGNVKLDLNGKATFPGVPAGSHYVFGQAIYSNQHLVWDLRVDLKPGANSVTLDQRNTVPLDADQAQANPSAGGSQSIAGSRPCPVTNAPRTAKPGARGNSSLSTRGAGYVYTVTDRTTGRVVRSERGNFSNTTFYLLDDDAEDVLQSAGIGPGMLGSRFAMMAFIDGGTQVENVPGMGTISSMLGRGGDPAEMAKLAKADFECAMKAIRAHSAAQMTTDANARGTFPSVPAGTYHLYGRFYRIHKPVRAGGMSWNLKVGLKPGQNTVTLSVDNAAWIGP